MDHTGHIHINDSTPGGISKFMPLIIIFTIILAFTFLRQYLHGWNTVYGLNDFMAGFFLVFGAFKAFSWNTFAEAYSSYDIIAKRSRTYAFIYPLIEIILGLAFLFRLYPVFTNLVTLLVMSVSAIGVIQALAQKEEIQCACLGTIFKIPMTKVTLFEDLLMAAMAIAMLYLI